MRVTRLYGTYGEERFISVRRTAAEALAKVGELQEEEESKTGDG